MHMRKKVIASFAIVYIVWGSTYVAIRFAAQLLQPALLSGLRYSIAAILLFTWLLVRGVPVRLPRHELVQAGALGVLMFSLNTTLVNYGARRLSAGVVSLFLATIPLFIAILEAGLRAGSMSTAGWLGTCTGFAGLVLLTWYPLQGKQLTSGAGLACLAVLFAAAVWAVGSVISKRLSRQASPLVLGAWQMMFAGVVNLAGGVFSGGVQASHWTASAWLATLYLATFGSVVCYTSYLFLLRTVNISTLATYAYINPVVAIIFGWLILHERPHGLEWVGMAVVLTSVAIVIPSVTRNAKKPFTSLQAQTPASVPGPIGEPELSLSISARSQDQKELS